MSRSPGVGLLAGGGQRLTAVTQASREAQPVVAVLGARPVRVPGPVQGGEQPVAGAVAGEDAAGAVGAVRGGRQPDDQNAGRGIPEALAPAAASSVSPP